MKDLQSSYIYSKSQSLFRLGSIYFTEIFAAEKLNSNAEKWIGGALSTPQGGVGKQNSQPRKHEALHVLRSLR